MQVVPIRRDLIGKSFKLPVNKQFVPGAVEKRRAVAVSVPVPKVKASRQNQAKTVVRVVVEPGLQTREKVAGDGKLRKDDDTGARFLRRLQ